MVDAVHDYRFLLDRGYPARGALRLVGDRYRLTSEERVVLYRGVCASAEAAGRAARIISVKALQGSDDTGIAVDGYNLLFTLLNYRLGRRVFICDDGLVRDAGGAHRRVTQTVLFREVMSAVCGFLSTHGIPAHIVLDAPLTHSRDHAVSLRAAASESDAPVVVELADHADARVAGISARALATSDSDVIDRSGAQIVDLARAILEERYDATIRSLSELYPRSSRIR